MRRVFPSCLVAVVYFLAGCANLLSNPKDVLSKYLDAELHGKHEEAYQYISNKDKSVKTKEQYLSGEKDEPSPFVQMFASRISYKIRNMTISGTQAKADVEITAPDVASMFGDMFGVALTTAMGGQDEKKLETALTEKYKDKSLPMTTYTESFNLIKESGSWRVFLDWATKDKVEATLKQAKQLEESKRLYDAKQKYQEVLELDAKAVEASKIQELDSKIESFKEKQAYVDKIEIRDVHIGKGLLGETGVFGEVKNQGDRVLKEVEFTIYCLDKDGKAVFEKKYHPVRVSGFFSDNEPLKPNYSKPFGVKLDDAPSDWAGRVQVKVSDLEFE